MQLTPDVRNTYFSEQTRPKNDLLYFQPFLLSVFKNPSRPFVSLLVLKVSVPAPSLSCSVCLEWLWKLLENREVRAPPCRAQRPVCGAGCGDQQHGLIGSDLGTVQFYHGRLSHLS